MNGLGTKRKPETTLKPQSKIVKFLSDRFPNMKQDEVELLARISTKKELQEYAEAHGTDKKDAKL